MTAPLPGRRLLAVGVVLRRAGRTTTLLATSAGASGRITPARTRT